MRSKKKNRRKPVIRGSWRDDRPGTGEHIDHGTSRGSPAIRGSLEPVERLVGEEIVRLGGIIEGAPGSVENRQLRRKFEDLLRGCEYTFRGGQLVIYAPHPARAARIRLDGDRIAQAWQELRGGAEKPAIVVRVEPAEPE